MFAKLGSYMDLFRKGSEVSDPEKWKSRQITGTMVAGVLIALMNLAKAYGVEIPISTDDINQLGIGVIAMVNIVFTLTTSKRAGVLPAKPDVEDRPDVLEPAQQELPQEPEVRDEVQTVTPTYERQNYDKDIYIG